MTELKVGLYFKLLGKVHKDICDSPNRPRSVEQPKIILESATDGEASIEGGCGCCYPDTLFYCVWGEDDIPGVVIQKAVNKYFHDKSKKEKTK